LERHYQLTLQYHELGSHQEMNQTDLVFNEMAAHQGQWEAERQQLKSSVAILAQAVSVRTPGEC
jgi:hypothetical protein